MKIPHEKLRLAIRHLLEHGGSERAEAKLVADHLVDANLAGHDSHGIGMIPHYVRNLENGTLVPNLAARLEADDGAILRFDGQRGYGQRVAAESMQAAMDRCRETGVALMTLRNAHHIGRVGTYGHMAADAGLVSLHFVNVCDHSTTVAPFGGTDGRFVTNPVCMAMPAGNNTPATVLDMATSKVALGKVRVAMNEGRSVADDLLLDNQGQPSNDPQVMFDEPRGALLTMGEHKGYGLATFCELLGGALSGHGTIQPGTTRRGGIVNNMFAVVVDPGRLVDRSWLANEIDDMVSYFKASPPRNSDQPVMVAGDPERISRAQRLVDGIPVDPVTWTEIEAAAQKLKFSTAALNADAGLQGTAGTRALP